MQTPIRGLRTILLGVVVPAAVTLVGCASTKISNRDEYTGGKIARPDRIVVYDFAATTADLPIWSEARKTHEGTPAPASAKEVEIGRKLGTHIAEELVKRIEATGLTATRADGQPEPNVGDIVIVGSLTSMDMGSGFERVVLGFGSGSANLHATVEGYLTTQEGFRKLGSGDVDAGGGKSPGVVVPLIVTVATANPIGLLISAPIKIGSELTGRSTIEGEGKRMADKIADELEIKFREQGWIEK